MITALLIAVSIVALIVSLAFAVAWTIDPDMARVFLCRLRGGHIIQTKLEVGRFWRCQRCPKYGWSPEHSREWM